MLLGVLASQIPAASPTPLPEATGTPTPTPEWMVHYPGPPLAALPSWASRTVPATPLRPSDLWSFAEDIPGVVLDRVNVAGSESALQPIATWRGDPGTGASWTLDGIDIGDPAAPGASAAYLHPELVRAETVAAGDIEVRTPGVPVRLSTRRKRGTRLFLRFVPDALQSDNLSAAQRDGSLQVSRTRLWGEAGLRTDREFAGGRIQTGLGGTWTEHRQAAFTEHDETHRLTSALLRVSVHPDAQSAPRIWLSVLRADKTHLDRDTTLSASPEARWRQSGPVYVVTAGGGLPVSRDVWASLKAGYVNSTFRLDPPGGTRADSFEDFRGIFHGSYLSLASSRRRVQIGGEVQGNRGPFRLLGGVGYRWMPVSTRSGWPGNAVQAFEREQVFFRTFRLTGFAIPTRDQHVRSVHDHGELYGQATYARDHFMARLGFRLDRVSGRNRAVSIEANPVVPDLLPAMSFGGSPARFRWVDLLPHAGVTWQPAGRPWRLHARYDTYAAALGSGDVTFDHPGREVASISYYWRDRNGDRTVQADEIETARGRLGWTGIDPDQPASPLSLHQIDPDLRAPRTHEWSVTADLGHAATKATVTAYYRLLTGPLWRPVRGLTRADYAIRGAVRGTLFDDAYSVGYYAPASASRIPPGNGRILTNRSGYQQHAGGVELQVCGTLRRVRWSAWASAAEWRETFTDEELAIIDPTSTDGEPNRNGGAVAARAGGFGRDLFVNARWSGGLTASADLPAGLAGHLLLHAREGFPIPYVHLANSGDPTTGAKSVLISPAFDTYRLPPLLELDLRVERAWRIGNGRKLVAGADVFNVLDSATPLQVVRDVESPSFAKPRERLRPRIVRLGVTFEF